MDFQTMLKKCTRLSYASPQEFIEDAALVFENAEAYNKVSVFLFLTSFSRFVHDVCLLVAHTLLWFCAKCVFLLLTSISSSLARCVSCWSYPSLVLSKMCVLLFLTSFSGFVHGVFLFFTSFSSSCARCMHLVAHILLWSHARCVSCFSHLSLGLCLMCVFVFLTSFSDIV